MMLFKKSLFILFLVLGLSPLRAQNSLFTGTFSNANRTAQIQFKTVGSELHGVLVAEGNRFAIKAQAKGSQLKGKVYTLDHPESISASAQNNSLFVSAFGLSDTFYQTSPQHQLDGIDLKPYMYGENSESSNTSPATSQVHSDIHSLIAGSQLVYYTSNSILSDNRHSSITYVNFCRDGRFWLNYDGSFSVKGSTGGSAMGASNGTSYGTWELISQAGSPYLRMNFQNGRRDLYPVYKHLILQGSWKNGNTKYAIQRNKVQCP
ncbi:MAG: hypothetical protein AAFU64_08795 [Bacteroidota bacterium]